MCPGSHLVVVAVDCGVGRGGGECGRGDAAHVGYPTGRIMGVLQIKFTGLDSTYLVAPVKGPVQGGGAKVGVYLSSFTNIFFVIPATAII
jgi:hypothetical protein